MSWWWRRSSLPPRGSVDSARILRSPNIPPCLCGVGCVVGRPKEKLLDKLVAKSTAAAVRLSGFNSRVAIFQLGDLEQVSLCYDQSVCVPPNSCVEILMPM